MQAFLIAGLVAAWAGPPTPAPRRPTDEEFLKGRPAVGEMLPDVTVFDPSGKEVKTSSLRGHHTVLVFGCLT